MGTQGVYKDKSVAESRLPDPGLGIQSGRPLWRNRYILSLLLAVGISYVGFGLVAPLRTLYARHEGSSAGEVGLMSSAYLFSAFVFLFPFGWLSDRYSRVALIVFGLIAHGLITLGFLAATSGEWFIALRFLEGVTAAAVMPAARALLADHVPAGRNGEAFGLLGAAITFGLLAGPPAGSFLAEVAGYTPSYLLAAFIFVPAVIVVAFTFRNYRPVNSSTTARNQEAVGEQPLRLFTLPVVAGCLVKGGLAMGPGLATSIWSLYMADLGFSLSLIGWTYTVYAIPLLLISPAAGRLSDRYGRLGMMFAGGLLVSLTWMVYGLVTAFVIILLLGIIEGSFDAVARTANDGYLADRTPPEIRGRAQALFNAAMQLGMLIGALGAGYLYEISHTLPFFVLGGTQFATILLGLTLLLVGRRTRTARPAAQEQSA